MLTWIILRAAGIGAYLMLFSSVSWGLVATTSVFGKKVPKATAVSVHQFVSSVGLIFFGTHIGGLLLDRYMPFHPLDILVPLKATFKPVAVAFGIAAMYSMIVVLVSSWTRRHIGPKWWRRLHLLTISTFSLAMVHGVFAGTDTGRAWMWWTYMLTGGSVLFLLLVRGLTAGVRPQRAAVPAPARDAAAA